MTRHNAQLQAARDLEHQAHVDQAIRDSVGTTSTADIHYHDPADAQHLRGIPAIGGRGSLGGHIPGTRPDHWQPDQRTQKRRKL